MKKLALLCAGVSMIAFANVAQADPWNSQQHNQPLPVDAIVAVNWGSNVKVDGIIKGDHSMDINGSGGSYAVSGLGAGAIKSVTANNAPSSVSPCPCTTTSSVNSVIAAANVNSPVTVTGRINGAGDINAAGGSFSIGATGALATNSTTTNYALAAPSGGNQGGGHGGGHH